MVTGLEKRRLIVDLRNKRVPNTRIADLLTVSRRTVQRLSKRFTRSHSLLPLPKSGRPRRLTARDERVLVRRVIANPKLSPTFLSKDLTKELKRPITSRIVKLTLRRNGFRARKAPKKPRLTKNQRQARLNFAREYVDKPIGFWKRVIFSDESSFPIFSTACGHWVWRRPHERYEPRSVIPTVKHGGGYLHIWGCLTYKGIGWMCSLPHGLDSETYLEILKDELQETTNFYFSKDEPIVFQQDGASVHTAKIILDWFKAKKMQLLNWPACSPDLNPLENLWANLKKRVAQNQGDLPTKDSLWEAIQKEWEATPVTLCKNLIESMHHRLKAVIDAHGGPTKY
jgi:transposase